MALKDDRYTYRITWSEEDQEYVGLCAEFPSLSWLTLTPEAALKGIRKVVADVVHDMREHGEEPPEPLASKRYSGKFMVRVPPEVHRDLALQAAEAGVSLNRLASAKLSRYSPYMAKLTKSQGVVDKMEKMSMVTKSIIEKKEFVNEIIRVARERGYKIEINARNNREQIDFGNKKLHAGHVEALYPEILDIDAHIPTLIEKVAPGRPCSHKPIREIMDQLRREGKC